VSTDGYEDLSIWSAIAIAAVWLVVILIVFYVLASY
jgi:hypothetical protein